MADEQEQTKAILPFLKRADELQNSEPKVAYYCRMYAVDTALQYKQRGPKVDGVLRALLSKLEKDKAGADIGDGDREYCRSFAETVFARADRADRAGKANKGTALTFLAASFFIDILRQFGELAPELADMQKYAAWKAADISIALREGRTPTPGNGNAAASDLSLPGVPTHTGEATPPQDDHRASVTSSGGFGSVVSSPGNQYPGRAPAGEADELPGVPAPGQHYHPPSPSFRQAGGQPHPPADGPPPPQIQGGPSQHHPQPPGQWDHTSWQQPPWHSSHASNGQPPQPPPQQSHRGLGTSGSLPQPPPLSGYSQPSMGLRDGGRGLSQQHHDSVPSPRAGQHEGSPPSSPSPAGRHSPSPDAGLEAARQAWATQQRPGPHGGGAAFGGGGGPSFSRSDSVVSATSSADAGPQAHPVLIPKFPPGARVLYDAYDAPAPVRGTVHKSEWKDKGFLYTVALQKEIVQVLEHILAPEFQPGDSTGLRTPGGGAEPVYVLSTNAQQWPPTYTVSRQSGEEVTVSDSQLVSQHQQRPQQQQQQQPSTTQFPSSQPSAPPLKHSTYVPEPPRSSDLGGSSFSGPRGATPRAAQSTPRAGQSTQAAQRNGTGGPPDTGPPAPPPPAGRAAGPPAAMPYVATEGFKPPLSAVMEAQKLTKQAGSSLGFEDVATAVKNLNTALRLLTMPASGR